MSHNISNHFDFRLLLELDDNSRISDDEDDNDADDVPADAAAAADDDDETEWSEQSVNECRQLLRRQRPEPICPKVSVGARQISAHCYQEPERSCSRAQTDPNESSESSESANFTEQQFKCVFTADQ